ncbi:leucine-rich repeat-containing protein 74A-like isoform X1 [Mytilus trossulus]|uniref:leucine-rich repeat-containing protein 74A-like isoform X1 n=1 Tax=Mytilus trossulus TaxID=6551 RepID=UPI0030069769
MDTLTSTSKSFSSTTQSYDNISEVDVASASNSHWHAVRRDIYDNIIHKSRVFSRQQSIYDDKKTIKSKELSFVDSGLDQKESDDISDDGSEGDKASDDEEKSTTSREFDTDLDASDEGESEDEAKEDIDIGHYSYIHACEQLGNPPIRKIFEQLQTQEISVQYVGLNTNDVIALAYGLLHNSRVESVDIEDNRMSEEGMLHVIELLNYNNVISSLSLSNNRMTVNCAGMLKEAISNNAWLTHLNLSGTKFGDDGAKHLGLAIRSNISIIWMNLSHNDIGVTGAQHIGRALSINDTLEVLDLSWNHIRRMGALAICKGLQENSSIVNFNLSMNGFGIEGSLALENVFKENMSLKCIDLSNNRINWDGLVYLTRGLRKNNVLRILKLGDNPLPVDGIQNLLHAVSSHRSNLTHLSLENVPVNVKVMEEVHIIASRRLFTITHGGVLDSTDMFGIKRGRGPKYISTLSVIHKRREDPFTLLIRFIGMMGIRILDLFRIFESGAQSTVSKDNFIRGVKKVGAPLSDREIELVAKRLARKGQISYSILANGVRNHMREEKKEDKRQETIEVKKQEHRKNFLKSDLGEVKPPDVKELTMYKTVAGKNFARIMSSSNMLSSRKESPSPTSSRVSLLPRLVDKIVTINRSAKSILSQETHRLESAKRRKRQKIFSIV